MKVRILGNSLRFRLKQPEVTHFQQHGEVTETTEFGSDPGQQFRFTLKRSPEPDYAISFVANVTTIRVPEHVAEKWAGTEQVGFDARIDTGKGRVMEVLVEKDFACLDAPEEDNLGTYPNPNAVC